MLHIYIYIYDISNVRVKQTNGLSLNGCNVVMPIATTVLIAYERSDYGLVTQRSRAARYFPGITQNQTSTQGKCKYYNAFGNIAGALCKFTGTLTLICRVVARLCTIIHVLLHQPSSSSYSLSSSFSFSPFIRYAFCVVSIDTTQCGAVSKVPTNIWQGRVKSTTKCDKRNRERESSKCGTGEQIQEITTSNKVSCIKISKLLYTKECVINNFLRDSVRIICVLVMVLAMYHDYRSSWKQVKDEDSTIERVGMQLENKRLSRSNFNLLTL